MQIFDNPNYDFVKYRWHAVIISLILIAIGAAVFATRGVNLGIDFAGGANVVLKFREDVPLAELRNELKDATIQQYGPADQRSVLIRLPNTGKEGDYAGQTVAALNQRFNPEAAAGRHDLNYLGTQRLTELLTSTDPDAKGTNLAAQTYYRDLAERVIARRSGLGIFRSMQEVTSTPGLSANAARVLSERAFLGKFNVLNQETVGPQVGKELQGKALLAILLSTLAMFAYIWVRFDFTFGIAAIACIIHDVLIGLAFLVIMNLEFSLNVVAAILTIVGYSINDTVVMYDRIRENRRKIKKPMTLAQHLNDGMNQTLSRTILTAGTVFLVLLAMLIFGGDVIRGFSWIMLIGVISGTYSTLLILPAVALALDKRQASRKPVVADRRTSEAVRDVPAPRARRAS